MTGYQNEQIKRSRFGRWVSFTSTGVIIVLLFVVFVVSVFWFRKPKLETEDAVDSIAHILQPDPISQAVIRGAIDTQSPIASLFQVVDHAEVGQVKRGKKDSSYFIELVAILPEIDREKFFYQVWLVRPIPYDFFPIGEMMTNELGEFVLDWQGVEKSDYSGYVEIVITQQVKGGVVDPQGHIVEGKFGL